MVTSLFVTILCMAAVGGAGYCVLKLADLTLGGRMGQGTRCRWAAIVAAAHLVPVHFLWRLVPVRVEPQMVAGGGFSGHVAAPVTGAVVGAGHSFTAGTGAGTVETVNAAAVGRADILKILAAVWIAGVCVCALWSLWRFLRARRALMRGSSEAGAELYAAASDAARELGIRKAPVVRTCPGLGSPTLVGFLRPVILMPEAELTQGQARMLFCHELTHFKRGDLWKKALMNAVRAVHWYDPAVWLLGRDLEYWIETACDEAVTGPMEKERRREYGYLLIEFSTASRPMGVPLGSGRRKLERRIKTMMKSTKKKRAIIGAALALAILAGCAGVSAIAAAYDKVELIEDEGPLPDPQRDADGNILPKVEYKVIDEGGYLDENGEPVPTLVEGPKPEPQRDADGNILPKDLTPTEYLEDGTPVPKPSGPPEPRRDAEGNIIQEDLTPTEYLEDGTPVPKPSKPPEPQTDAEGNILPQENYPVIENGYLDENGEPVPKTVEGPIPSAMTEGTGGLTETSRWDNAAAGHYHRVKLPAGAEDGYFTLTAGTTATFTFATTNGEAENIIVEWIDSNGNCTQIYRGKTADQTLSLTSDETTVGNIYVTNLAAATIYYNASLEC